ncbi:MAG: NAD(P)-binding protein [Acidilobaceae archaeon]|nr:NAD(P)-binding protein [Acidilobaceae archaeon]
MEAYVVGGGMAGAGAAFALARAGLRTTVLEAQPKLGLKPCGRGIPQVGDLPFSVPKEAILNEIRAVATWLDGEPLFRYSGGLNGYIVDKGGLLEHIFAEAGAEVVYNAKYNVRTGTARVNGEQVEVKKGVFAAGFAFYEGERIPVVQYIMKGPLKDVSYDTIEVHFNTEIMGYYYVFPHGEDVEVGVGGFAAPRELWAMLDKFIEKDSRLRGRILAKESSAVSVGGVKLGYVNGLPKAGEAAGYVMPLTGEGNRPSTISGYLAGKAVAEGKDPLEAQRRSHVTRGVELQRRLLEWTKSMEVRERREVIRSLPPEVHAEVALATFRIPKMMMRLAHKPLFMLKVAAKLVR